MQQYQEQLSALMTQIPDDVARMAHEQQLGSPQASYMIFELRKGWREVRWILPLAFFFALLWFVSMIFLLTINSFLLIGSSFFLIFMAPLAITYILMLAGLIAMSLTRRTCTLYPCDGGLILRQSRKKFRVIRWEEIEIIQQTASRLLFMIRNSNLYTLRCHDGDSLTFSGHPRFMNKLAPIFEDHFTRRRLPFWLADYQAGQTLHFGPVRIDRNGVAVGEKMLPWEQVADISLLKGRRLVIYKAGERQEVWLSLPAFKIDNLSILLVLFKRIRSGHTDQEAGLQAITTTYGAGTTIVSSKHNRIDPLPEGLASLADEHQLGERRLDQQLGRNVLTSWAQIITMSAIGSVLLAGSAIFIVASLLSESFRRDSSPFITITSYSILFGAMLIIAAILHFRQIHNHTYTFERGLILKHGGQAPAIVRWEEIETVWHTPAFRIGRNNQSTVPPRVSGYTFQLRNGSKHTLNRFNMRMDILSKLIQEQVVPLQLPTAIDAYQTGQTLTFGKVRVNQQGISIGERSLPWPQVKSVTLQENKLAIFDITQRKPWGSVKAKEIPNLFLLFELADYARNGAKPAE